MTKPMTARRAALSHTLSHSPKSSCGREMRLRTKAGVNLTGRTQALEDLAVELLRDPRSPRRCPSLRRRPARDPRPPRLPPGSTGAASSTKLDRSGAVPKRAFDQGPKLLACLLGCRYSLHRAAPS